MNVTVVGSVALDTVETPWGRSDDSLGGSAIYFALAAAHYAGVEVVGVVGDDFPAQHVELLAARGVGIEGLERVPGKTFRWSGRYHEDVNLRDTLDTQLNVFEQFHPKLPEAAGRAEYLFLGNIHPSLQQEVLDQAEAKFIALDTMNLWINNDLDELKAVLRKVHAILINDSEVQDLTGDSNIVRGAAAIRELGPAIVVVKKGAHGCLLFHGESVFSAPALPMGNVVDPTGAGDSFAGGFMGYLAQQNDTGEATLRRAVIHGSTVASFTCEAFGPGRLAEIDADTIAQRYQTFQNLVAF